MRQTALDQVSKHARPAPAYEPEAIGVVPTICTPHNYNTEGPPAKPICARDIPTVSGTMSVSPGIPQILLHTQSDRLSERCDSQRPRSINSRPYRQPGTPNTDHSPSSWKPTPQQCTYPSAVLYTTSCTGSWLPGAYTNTLLCHYHSHAGWNPKTPPTPTPKAPVEETKRLLPSLLPRARTPPCNEAAIFVACPCPCQGYQSKVGHRGRVTVRSAAARHSVPYGTER
jgi:hypothetical protein